MNKIEKNIKRKNHKKFDFFSVISCVLLISGIFHILMFYYNSELDMVGKIDKYIITALYAGFFYIISKLYEQYYISIKGLYELVYSAILSLIITNVVFYVVIFLIVDITPSIGPFITLLIIQVVALFIWAFITKKLFYKLIPKKRTLVIDNEFKDIKTLINNHGLDKRYQVVEVLSSDQVLEDIENKLEDIQAVFIAGIKTSPRNSIIKYCVENAIDAYVIPKIGDVIMQASNNIHLFHLPTMKLERYNPSLWYLFLKRTFDITVSGLALLVTLPFFMITALAIKLYDGGQIFYKQERLTKDGKKFNVIKFRSMRMDAEKDGPQLSTGKADNRITPIGKIIRATRLDELPQLINILNGDMSIVGPRPERPEISKEYEEDLPEFRLRLQAKAGLTGYAQVYGKYNTTPYDKLLMDLMYMSKPNFIEDIRICFATIKILFMSESTEGISEDKKNAK